MTGTECTYEYKDPKTGEIKQMDLSYAETITISRDVLQMMFNMLEPEQIGNVMSDVIRNLYFCGQVRPDLVLSKTKVENALLEQVMDNIARFHSNKQRQQSGLKQNNQ